MSVDTESFDSAPVSDAIAALEAETPAEPELSADEGAPEGEVAEQAPAEAAPAPSRADKVREEALRREAEREAKMPVAEPPPRAPDRPDPLAEYQAEEIRRSVEFARLFQRNPLEAARRAGMDPLKVTQLFLKEGQQPGALAAEEQQSSVLNELKAVRERLEQREQADLQARQMQAQQAEAARLVNEFKSLAGDVETYPLLSGLDDDVRMEEAAIAEQRYFKDYGDWPSMQEVAELVEGKLEKLQSRIGGGQSNGASKGAAKQKVNQVTRGASRRSASITNDLAAETAASVDLDMSEHAVLKRAEMALRRVGAE